MAIQYQPQVFTFAGSSLNSKSDDFQLQAPQLLKADNVRFQKSGAATKRPGFIKLPTQIIGGGDINSGSAIQTYNDELLAFDGTYIYSFIESMNAWANRGLAISIINEQNKIISTRVAAQNNPDGTNMNGQELYVWEDTRQNGTGIRYSIIDSDSGAFIVADQLLYQLALKPKVIAANNQFYIYYCPGVRSLFQSTISTNSPNLVSPPSHKIPPNIITASGGISGISGTMPYDVCLLNGNPLVAYATFENTIIVNNHNVLSVSNVSNIAIMVDSTNVIWLAYIVATDSSNKLYIMTINSSTFATILAPVLIIDTNQTLINIALIEDINVGNCNLTFETQFGSNYNYISNSIIERNGTILQQTDIDGNPTIAQVQRSVGLASKPFKYNDQIYVNTIHQSTNQATYFTMCLTNNFSVVSKISSGVGGEFRTNGLLAECPNFEDQKSVFMFANQKCGAFTTNDNTSYSLLGVNASYLDFNNDNAFNSVVGANELHIVGGIEKIYDGISLVEDNFNLYAEDMSVQLVYVGTTGDYALSAGQYQYSIVYSWTSRLGNVYRGQPSIPLTVVVPQDGYNAQLTIPTLCITDKTNPRSGISIEVYRTYIVDGSPSLVPNKITSDLTPLLNDLSVDTIQFTDNLPDSLLQGNEPIYTSEQLYNSAPPACAIICPFLTRTFITGLEDPNVIWTSQDRFELDNYNTIPTEFSPILVEGVNSQGGPITGVAEMNGTCIVFKENSIYQFSGSGPSANGLSGNFSDATVIVEDTGCTNINSIIRIPSSSQNSGGLMYQAANKGIWLLDTGYLNHYIGAQVEYYNDYTITSAQLLDANNEVIFTTLEGVCLVYNYIWGSWNTWSHLPQVIDSTVWNNQLTLIRSDGVVLVQQDDNYLDYQTPTAENNYTNTQPIVRTIQLPWLQFAGIQGYQSITHAILLGHYQSPHTIEMSVLYDFDPAPKEPVQINSTLITNIGSGLPSFPAFGGGVFSTYQYDYSIGYPYCGSLSLLITDPQSTGDDVGAIFSAITFITGVVPNATIPMPNYRKFAGNRTPNGR